MFYDQAEQVLQGGAVVRQGGRQAPLQHAHAPRRRLRDQGRLRAGRHRVRGGQEVVREQQVQRPQRGVLLPRVRLRGAEPPEEERGDPAAPVVLEDHLQGRAAAKNTPTSARSRRRSRAGSAARSSSRPACELAERIASSAGRGGAERARAGSVERAVDAARVRASARTACRRSENRQQKRALRRYSVGRDQATKAAHFEAALWYRLLCAVRAPRTVRDPGRAGECDVCATSAVTFP